MLTTTKRAAKGGEYGANGEWYEGGKFINTIPENDKRHGSRKRGVRKVQIEPYVWVVQEGDYRQPLLSFVGIGAKWIDRYDWKKGICVDMPAFESRGGVSYYGHTIEQMQAICDRFNAGERFL